jgi:3-hydroxyisobutyrate dehydrogenase-like beta-hydroxyacid dehydrogenase
MGAPMARRLLQAGHNLTVWSHNLDKAEEFSRLNSCAFARTPAEVAKRSQTSFVCVGDTPMSRDVALGRHGLSEGAPSGSSIVDCSTISPTASKQIAAELAAKGIRFLDAPCTGSKAGAESGTLSFMVGGDPTVFGDIRPLLETMGQTLYYCGGPGMGLHAKVTQNLVLGNIVAAFNEGLVLSTSAGVDPKLMIEILNNTGARSGYVSAKADAVLQRNFVPTFSVRWLEKDLGLALEAGGEQGVPLATTAASQQQMRLARAMGYGDDDISGSIRALEQISSCQVVDPAE